MNQPRLSPAAWRLQGFSLIELIVSMAIGLIVLAATFSAYLSGSGASKIAEAQGVMNEDAQAALSILTQQLRMAGNNPDQPNRTDLSRRNPVYAASGYPPSSFETSNFTIRGCDGLFDNSTTANRLDDLQCPAGASTLPDAIALSYEADRFNTVPTVVPSNLPTDCLGVKLKLIIATLPVVGSTGAADAPVSYAVADNRFYIDRLSPGGAPSLYCKGNGDASTAQPLVENIEDFQLSYGMANKALTDNSATVAGYLTANEFVNQPDLAPLSNAERWARVLSVRICVLVRTAAPMVPDAASARYVNCDGLLETAPPDLRLRRAYFTTVTLRNRQL